MRKEIRIVNKKMTNTRPHGNDPKSTSIFENRRKSTSIGSFLSSFHCSYFMTPWVHVVACVASAENDPKNPNALYAAIWTQGVIKYEQWKLERKLPMLVLFRRFSKMLVLLGSFPCGRVLVIFLFTILISFLNMKN